MFLQEMSFTGNICAYLNSVRKANARNLAQCRIRLLRRLGFDLGANSTFLWRSFRLPDPALLHSVECILQCRSLGFFLLLLAALPNQLIDCRHSGLPQTLRLRSVPIRTKGGHQTCPMASSKSIAIHFRQVRFLPTRLL